MTEVTVERGIKNIIPDIDVTREEKPLPEVKQVVDTSVVFVPFADFEGRINQTNYKFRKDVPVRISKAESNVWLESRKGYIK